MLLPELVAEDDDVGGFAAEVAVGGLDVAAEERADAVKGGGVAGEKGDMERLLDVVFVELEVHTALGEDVFKAGRGFVLRVLLWREDEPAPVVGDVGIVDDGVHSAVAVGVGVDVEQDGVDDGEHGGGGTNAEGEREDGGEGERLVAPKAAEAVADILTGFIEPLEADGAAVELGVVPDGRGEGDAGLARRFGG